MSIFSLIALVATLIVALLLVGLVHKLSRSLWQSQVRLARLEQRLADLQVAQRAAQRRAGRAE